MSNAYLTPEERAKRAERAEHLASSPPRQSTYTIDPLTSDNRQSSYSSFSYDQPYYHNPHEPLRPTPHHGGYHDEDYDDRDDRDDRDASFDVRADFDGVGPRWTDLYGQKQGALLKNAERGIGDEEYKRLDSHIAPSGQMMAYGTVDPMAYNAVQAGANGYGKIEDGREELVSVPVLGSE